MVGLGTIINVIAVIIGATIGILLHKFIPSRLQNTVMSGIGLAVCFVGISGVISKMLVAESGGFSTKDTMLMIASLVIGAFVGELLNIEKFLERFGDFCKGHIKFNKENSRFTEGFVSASLLFCVGAMAIVGSLEDGLRGDYTTLFAKSLMDGTVAIFFAATMGAGVYLSILPVAIYQGAITLLAGVVKPLLSDALIGQLSLVGSVLIFAIGLNMCAKTKIKTGNLLPAVLVPVFYNIIINIF
ncbi:MAG: DUF554 domain-containing protein [Ruminococcaceae bacterium]|nr:DUF554 domain-containing protein [Oscillospiraceae bacterium]